MKISGKMWLMIILNVIKNQGFTLPLEDTFFKRPQEGLKPPPPTFPPPAILGLTDLSSEFIQPFFIVKELQYNLRNGYILNLPSARTTYYGTNSILFRACQVWNNLPLSIKQSQPLLEFKTNIKALRNNDCLCKICKIS